MTKGMRMQWPSDLSSHSTASCHYLSLVQSGKHPSERGKWCSKAPPTEDATHLACVFFWIVSAADKQAFATRNGVHPVKAPVKAKLNLPRAKEFPFHNPSPRAICGQGPSRVVCSGHELCISLDER